MSNLFQTYPGVGSVILTRSGDCSGYAWTTNWITGGNQPSLLVTFFKGNQRLVNYLNLNSNVPCLSILDLKNSGSCLEFL